MIPLTIPEIKRLLAALTTRPLPRWLVIHWDAWTRRHQARSRWFHKRTRLARNAEITSTVPIYGLASPLAWMSWSHSRGCRPMARSQSNRAVFASLS